MSWYAQVGRFSQGGCVFSALVIPAIKVVYIFFFNFTVPPAGNENSGFPHLNYLQYLKEAIHDLTVFGNLLRCTQHLILSWFKSRDGCPGWLFRLHITQETPASKQTPFTSSTDTKLCDRLGWYRDSRTSS